MLQQRSKLNQPVDSRITRVLLIDDNREKVECIRQMLAGSGAFRISATVSALEIKRKLEGSAADIIILGLSAADRRTSAVVRALKDSATPNPPVIIFADSLRKTRIPGLTPQEYLLKSGTDSSLLKHTIRSLVERQGTARELSAKMDEYQASEARYLNVILSTSDGIIIVNKRNRILFVNPAAQDLFGETQSDLRKRAFPFSAKAGDSKEVAIDRRSGESRVVEMRAVETTWEGRGALLISMREITARKKAEDALRASEERYALAIRGSKDGVWDWDLKTNRIYFCSQWKSMLGYSDEQIGNNPEDWFRRIHPSDKRRVKNAIQSHISGKLPHFESEHRIEHRDRTYRWVLARGTAIRDAKGKAVRMAGSQIDTTERKLAERELEKALNDLRFALASEKVLMEELDRKNKELIELSITDGLTGLYNHRFIQERFDFEFKRVRRYGGYLSCMMIDIDHFKTVNDTYGHQFGDLVLRQIAAILKTRSREVDICGRYGGEEFMVIANLMAEDALKFATKLHKSIENCIFANNNHSIHVTVSIGISEYGTDIKSKQDLIERADRALYQAKKDGRNLIRLWKEIDRVDDRSVDKYGIQDMKSKFVELSSQMRLAYLDSTNALVKAVDAKDPFAREHSQNVSAYASELAKLLNLPEAEIEVIRCAGMLHDIGKIGIRQDILVKKEQLTTKEFAVLKKHPEVGVNILKDVKFLEKEIPIILHHHERHDGSGYPYGLKEREIPLGARILGVADAFDAMTAGRTYKKKLSWSRALEELKKGSGKQFAPEMVEAFIKLVEQKRIGPGKSDAGVAGKLL